ncbi:MULTISPECIES: MFS transporter [unclassified Brevundimonas]|uniref:MFS transporter n=1 Tax=unclassified Brevundimonas TaxID=2622653 RepID=UPI000CFC6AA2|nr:MULTISPECIES: MFS transporter [unclassified Brevundimonas]PRA33279.1 MFS transporter [Brevundimonas sp. MYb27]PQZ83882.1 MFS transporter [Brevundimonas sp. MYb31]PRB13811.1 MFS transporter [Brevundimonas sp. MYb52]PRB34456.1 MFS transporter [Brevundimonas sp. MYb46]PRB53934.1 MFS transporter [Brevundimonas sp. MYb33]
MSRRNWDLPWDDYLATLKPHERPALPGSPATPDHSTPWRLAYACVGVLVALTGSLGNAAVTANIPLLAGSLGVTTTEASWLPIVFVMTNACMNLLLVKFRMQYGLRLFTEIILMIFLATATAHLFLEDYGSTLVVRGIAGIAAAGMSTLGILYIIQAFPAQHRLKGIIIGVGLSSLAIPLARLGVGYLLDRDLWRAVYMFDLGLVLIALPAVFALKMPPSQRVKAFETLDFVTFALFAPGVALLTAVLGLGRIVWWTEAPWIGLALIGALVLLTAAVIIEYNRANPLIDLKWLAGGDIVRLLLAILLVRIVLSEQTTGAVGFLQQMGLGYEQMHSLFWVMLFATAAGTLTSAFTLNPTKLWKPISIALGLIAVGAFMDSHATVLTRPANLYFSQALLGFAAAFFIGPTMIIGFGKVLQGGGKHMVSFIVVFSIGQNVGGLMGSALVGTIQTLREKFHSNQLSAHIDMGDPEVVLRLQQLGGAYAHTVGDAAQRQALALKLLQQQISQQAQVLAYNDVFLLIAAAAAVGALWVAVNHYRPRIEARRAAHREAAQAAAAAAVE